MLHKYKETRYSPATIAKSVVGRRNPLYLKATIHAPSVFFYVVAFAHPFKGQRLSFICCTSQTMVAQAGQLLSWPVSFRAGIPTPVWATTILRRRNLGGSIVCYLKEVAIWPLSLRYLIPNSFIYFLPCVVQTSTQSRLAYELLRILNFAPESILLNNFYCFLLVGCPPLESFKGRTMMNNKVQMQATTLTELGENRLIRVAQATTFLAELLNSNRMGGQRAISAEGIAALIECLAEQMESVVAESSLMMEVKSNDHN